MSKTKKTTMGNYEILFIVPNKFTEDEAKQIIEKVEAMITSGGGNISFREYWGKKKLAYEIKHNAYGYYSLAEFNVEKSAVLAIDQALKLYTDVLRHQIVVKNTKSEKEVARNKKITEKIEAKKAEETKEAKKQEEKELLESKPKTTKTNLKKSSAGLKDLDEKLADILNANDLI